MAPRAGFEPATNRLTAGDSTAELPWNENGGDGRNRTDDILLAKQALSRLSYGPEMVHKDGIEPPTRAPSTRRSTSELLVRNGAAGGKSNPSSPRWQRGALPLSYGREIGGQGPSRTATDYAGRLQRLGLANAQPARDWLRFEHAFRGYEPRPGPGYRSVIPPQRCEALNS